MFRKLRPSWTWAFWLHRISGVSIALFIMLHTADVLLMLWGPSVYNNVMRIFRLPVIRVLELVLIAAVIYHAVNGLRVILLDFWPSLCRYQLPLLWIGLILMLVMFAPAAVIILQSLFFA